MFKKVLIANRGEIAIRVIKACNKLGIKTVAIYSEADKDSLHVKLSDESYCVGPPPVTNSYLNIPNIISAALISKAEAIHPGYGFLAENVEFAEVCESHQIVFIGPTSKNMALMGNKSQARKFMSKSGLPVIPGTDEIKTEARALKLARKIGYPVILKAVSGGGGKGMRLARDQEELSRFLATASLEAQSSFGDGRLYLEKYLLEPRHIEFQILADNFGHIIHLGERDCSVQRRNQKLIEESPSGISEKLRKQMGKAAIKGAKSAKYRSCGTMEFLIDNRTSKFYFLEMNTRIQVEHPVTEMVTGIDLVLEQIKIAAGEKISFKQKNISITGHALECRINAEDPENNFTPSIGKISELYFPEDSDIRIDTHVFKSYEVPPFYDSLLAKVIIKAENRLSAIDKMCRVLEAIKIKGIKTTIPFHLKILKDAFFKEGAVSTNFVEKIGS